MRSNSSCARQRITSRLSRGFTLIELMLTLAIASSLTIVYQSYQVIEASETALAQGIGQHLLLVRAATERYLQDNFLALSNASPVVGFANPLAPTITELIANSRLSAGFPTKSPTGQSVVISLTRTGCPGTSCVITGLVMPNGVVTVPRTGATARLDLASIAVQAMQGAGGMSSPATPGTIRGSAGSYPNPYGAAEGVVAAFTYLDTTFWNQFVRMNDTRDPNLLGNLTVGGNTRLSGTLTVQGNGTFNGSTSMNGALTMNNQSIIVRNGGGTGCVQLTPAGVITIGCAGTLNAISGVFTDGAGNTTQIGPNGITSTGNVQASNGFTGAGGTTAFTAAEPTSIRVQAGDFFVRGPAGVMMQVTASGDVLAAGDVAATTNLRGQRMLLNAPVAEGAACTPDEVARLTTGGLATCVSGVFRPSQRYANHGAACNNLGAIATDQATEDGMICRGPSGGSTWTHMSALMAALQLKSSTTVSDGSVLPKPSCPITGPNVPMALIFLVPQNDTSTDVAFRRYADDNGGSWTVHLQNGDGTPQTGNALALAACHYPGI